MEIAKPRDFGEIINDTFTFIRQNLKSLLKSFFIFCGFFMLAGGALSFLQQFKARQMFNELATNSPATFASGFSDMWVSYLFIMVISICMYTASTVTVLSFISLYKQKDGVAPEPVELWVYVKYYFLRTSGALVIIAILLSIAFVLCLVPGIWLFPIFGLIFPIIIMENASFGYAFTRSFALIKDNWWATAGAVLVIWIIVYFLFIVILMPISLLSAGSIFLHPQKMPIIPLWVTILTVIAQQFAQLIMIIPLVGIALCYFNLVESKEGTSLLDRISKFGGDPGQTSAPSEEY